MKEDPGNCLLSEHEDRYWIGPSPAVCFEPRPKRQAMTAVVREDSDIQNRDVSSSMIAVREWLDKMQIKWEHETRPFKTGGVINDTIFRLHSITVHITEHAQCLGAEAIVFGTMVMEVLYPGGGNGIFTPPKEKFLDAKDAIIQQLQKMLNCMEP